MALALARKYRPKSFASVAVQSHVSNTLKGAIARGRVAHGYLFCGPRGTGKTTLARVLAMALNCERKGEHADGEPCGHCDSCTRIWAGSASLDVIEIDAASNRGVDDARELRERAMYAPSGPERYKVYIVDEAHMLTREAWNALLKILEEPPPRVVFVFATTEPQKIAQAAAPVLSRVQRFDLKRIPAAEVRARLATVLDAEGVVVDAEALGLLSRAADGSMRDALSLADQVLAISPDAVVSAERVREALGLVAEDEYLAMLQLIAERRAGDVFAAMARLADVGVDFVTFLGGLADMLRAQLAVTLGGVAPDVSERVAAALVAGRDRWTAADLVRMLSAITELEPRFRRSGQQRLLLETVLVRFALLDKSVELETLLRELQGEGSPDPAPRPPRSAPVTPPPSAAPVVRDRVDVAGPRSESRTVRSEPKPLGAVSPGSRGELVSRWGEIVASVRSPLLATALGHATPDSVEPGGVVVLRLVEPNEIFKKKLDTSRDEIAAVLRDFVDGVSKVRIDQPTADGSTPPTPVRRLTAESVKGEQLAWLRRQDPVLDLAIDALDLELLSDNGE
jgi:DNA polymerase-3 subunit gamma/tau